MGEIGKFTRGRRFTKEDYTSDGIGCIHYGDIYTQYGTSAKEAVSHVRSELAGSLRFATTGDVVIAAVGETVEDVGKAVAWLGQEDVAVHDDCFTFHHDQNPKFVAYCFQTPTFNAEIPHATPERPLSDVARRALLEAAERRTTREAAAAATEYGGPTGPEPTRYGDWEKKGLAVDF